MPICLLFYNKPFFCLWSWSWSGCGLALEIASETTTTMSISIDFESAILVIVINFGGIYLGVVGVCLLSKTDKKAQIPQIYKSVYPRLIGWIQSSCHVKSIVSLIRTKNSFSLLLVDNLQLFLCIAKLLKSHIKKAGTCLRQSVFLERTSGKLRHWKHVKKNTLLLTLQANIYVNKDFWGILCKNLMSL